MLVEIPGFSGLNPDERLPGHFIHAPGGINLLGYAHLWVLEEITTAWWYQLLPHSIFQDPNEQDLTNRYGTEISLVASADGCDTSFHLTRWQGKVDLSTFSKRAGHKIPTGQLSPTDGEVWSSGVDRLPAHRSTFPGIATTPAWGADLIQPPCLRYSIARAPGLGELLLRHQHISSQHLWPERVKGL